MYKRSVSIILSFLLFVVALPHAAIASIGRSTLPTTRSDAVDAVVPTNHVEKIEKLYHTRAQLFLDYKKNKEEIAQIDNELRSLGVSSVDEGYVIGKKDACSSAEKNKELEVRASVPPYTGVSWESYRFQTNVNGILYELQIITGKPSTLDNMLLFHQITEDTKRYSYSAAGQLGFSLACTGASFIPGFAPYVALIEIAAAAYSYLTNYSNQIIHGVNSTAVTSGTTHIRYVFVKYVGDPDSKQIWMYMGNFANCTTAFTITFNKYSADGSCVAGNNIYQKSYTVTSNGYDDYYSMCTNYHRYKTSGTPFEYWYYIGRFTINNKFKLNSVQTNIWTATVSVPCI